MIEKDETKFFKIFPKNVSNILLLNLKILIIPSTPTIRELFSEFAKNKLNKMIDKVEINILKMFPKNVKPCFIKILLNSNIKKLIKYKMNNLLIFQSLDYDRT